MITWREVSVKWLIFKGLEGPFTMMEILGAAGSLWVWTDREKSDFEHRSFSVNVKSGKVYAYNRYGSLDVKISDLRQLPEEVQDLVEYAMGVWEGYLKSLGKNAEPAPPKSSLQEEGLVP